MAKSYTLCQVFIAMPSLGRFTLYVSFDQKVEEILNLRPHSHLTTCLCVIFSHFFCTFIAQQHRTPHQLKGLPYVRQIKRIKAPELYFVHLLAVFGVSLGNNDTVCTKKCWFLSAFPECRGVNGALGPTSRPVGSTCQFL